MEHNKKTEDHFLVSFSDIFEVFRRSKKMILLCALILGCLGALFALIKPIRYEAEATFREKSIKPSNISSSVLQMLTSGSSSGENEAMTMIKSRKLMQSVIDQLHLQGNLVAVEDIDSRSKNIKNNLKLMWASLMGKSKPVLEDICCPLKIASLQYAGEIPLAFKITVAPDGQFEVTDLQNSQNAAAQGALNQLFIVEDLSFTLAPVEEHQPIEPKVYILSVNSLNNTSKSLCKAIQIEFSKDDKNLLKLTFEHRQRHQASQTLNVVMDCFQDSLKRHHNEIADKQLDYLTLRKDQLTKNLNRLMEEHANFLSNDLYGAGFFDTDKEMEFLAKSQHDYKEKLIANELEIKRLENFNPSHLTFYDRYAHEGDPTIINHILGEIRGLKQDRDNLEIELQKKSVSHGLDINQSFTQHLDELAQVQSYLEELHSIENAYKEGRQPDFNMPIFKDPRFLLSGWVDRITTTQVTERPKTIQSFQYYLTNLLRLLGVYQRILQERLTHQHNPSEEYKGISLDVARNLYLDYSRQLVEMEGNIRQNSFFISQMEDPNFEITSLSAGLNDPVSSEMIRKSSELILNLRDQNNQSMREQERIKEDLNLQRTFLKLHLQQMIHLMQLNKQLFDEKIFALQNVSLELTHQHISLLEKNLQDYVQSRLFNLKQERVLIKKHLENISNDLATLPKKWMAEQLISQEVEINHLIVEEIARLVETKTISHKLEVIQSSPLDSSLPPVYPIQPKVFLWSFLGLLLGGFMGAGIALGRSIAQGMPVSMDNLRLIGFHVSGLLKKPLYSKGTQQLQACNLETLRRMQAYFTPSAKNESQLNNLLLLLEGEGPHYAPDLIKLFCMKGQRVLVLDLNFIDASSATTGLLQYLNGEGPCPTITKTDHGDFIASGGISPFTVELIGSAPFQKLVHQYKNDYDWILAVSKATPLSSEAEGLLSLFSRAAITLQNETSEQLGFYTWLLNDRPDYRLSFIVSPDMH